MPKIQVVINRKTAKIMYVGFNRAKAKELFMSDTLYLWWYETDDATEIDLGGNENE